MDTLWRWVSGSTPSTVIAQQIGQQTHFRPEPDVQGSLSSDAKISSSYIYGICEYLRHDRQVVALDLNNGWIGDGGAKALATLLASNKALATIYCSNNGIGDSGAQALEQPLETNYSLMELHLSRNKIGPKGASSIGGALKSNRTLRFLDLSSVDNDNKVGDDGAYALSQAIAINNVLSTLLLARNDITARGAGSFAQGLSMATCGLQILDLSGNRFGLGGARAMAQALKQNQSLLTLRLSFCELTDAGLAEIAKAVREHPAVTTIELQGNGEGSLCARELGKTAAEYPDILSYGIFDNIVSIVRSKPQPLCDLTPALLDTTGLHFLHAFLRPPKDQSTALAPPPLASSFYGGGAAVSAVRGPPPPSAGSATPPVSGSNLAQPPPRPSPLAARYANALPPSTSTPASGGSTPSAPMTPQHVTGMVQYQWAPPSAGVPLPRDAEPARKRDPGPPYSAETLILNNGLFNTRESGEVLAQIIIDSTGTKEFQFRNCSISDETLSFILQAIPQNTSVNTIDFSSDGNGAPNNITDNGASMIVQALTGHPALSTLRLTGNLISAQGHQHLQASLGSRITIDLVPGPQPQYRRVSYAPASTPAASAYPPQPHYAQAPPAAGTQYGMPPPPGQSQSYSAYQAPPPPAYAQSAPPPAYALSAPPPPSYAQSPPPPAQEFFSPPPPQATQSPYVQGPPPPAQAPYQPTQSPYAPPPQSSYPPAN